MCLLPDLGHGGFVFGQTLHFQGVAGVLSVAINALPITAAQGDFLQ